MPSTDNKPERIHSVRPVPRTMTCFDDDQREKEREEEGSHVVLFIHGSCLLARRGERRKSQTGRGLEERENPRSVNRRLISHPHV